MAWSDTGERVDLGKASTIALAANYELNDDNYVCKVYATTITETWEVRGLTKTAALALVGSGTSSSLAAFRTTHGSLWAVVPALIGTTQTVQAQRANDAGGWKAVYTKTTTTAEASWEQMTSA